MVTRNTSTNATELESDALPSTSFRHDASSFPMFVALGYAPDDEPVDVRALEAKYEVALFVQYNLLMEFANFDCRMLT